MFIVFAVGGGGAVVLGSFPSFTLATFRGNDAGQQGVVGAVGYGSGLSINNPNDDSE